MDDTVLWDLLQEQLDFVNAPDAGVAMRIPGINESLGANKPDKTPPLRKYNVSTKDGPLSFTVTPAQKRLDDLTRREGRAGNEQLDIAEAVHVSAYAERKVADLVRLKPKYAQEAINVEIAKKERVLMLLAQRRTSTQFIKESQEAADVNYQTDLEPRIANIEAELGVLTGLRTDNGIVDDPVAILRAISLQAKSTIDSINASGRAPQVAAAESKKSG